MGPDFDAMRTRTGPGERCAGRGVVIDHAVALRFPGAGMATGGTKPTDLARVDPLGSTGLASWCRHTANSASPAAGTHPCLAIPPPRSPPYFHPFSGACPTSAASAGPLQRAVTRWCARAAVARDGRRSVVQPAGAASLVGARVGVTGLEGSPADALPVGDPRLGLAACNLFCSITEVGDECGGFSIGPYHGRAMQPGTVRVVP